LGFWSSPEWLKADELVNAVEELWLKVFAHTLHHQLTHVCGASADTKNNTRGTVKKQSVRQA
jgi:hypothetical protein